MDEVYYGPIKLYESEASKARKQAEALKNQMDLEKSMLELEKLKRENPDNQIKEAGSLAQKAAEIEGTLKSYDTNTAINKKQLADIVAASEPMPSGAMVPNTIMPREEALQRSTPLEQRIEENNRSQVGLRAQLEATRRRLGDITGTVQLPEGMGTAPAGQFATVYEQRARELIPLATRAQRDIDATTDPTEKNAKIGVYSQMKSVADSLTKRAAEEARKIPGLDGMAATEANANEMRKLTSDFAAAAQNIDDLIEISENRSVENFQRSEAVRGALRGQLRTLLVGMGPMSDRDTALMNEMIANPINPFTPYAREKLLQLKGAIARKITSSASVYGFRVNKISDLVNAGGVPSDFKDFTTYKPSFRNEAEARAAGYKDGDRVKIGGVLGTLEPDKQNGF